jgi:hypothetical protein
VRLEIMVKKRARHQKGGKNKFRKTEDEKR